MKKILSVLMCFIVLFGVCVVGTACDPNKETEAEYKARIKKELDEIPVEATGYKLVDPTKQEVIYPEGEEPQRSFQSLMIDEHKYSFIFKYGNDFEGESPDQSKHKILFRFDDGELTPVIFADNKLFEKYNTDPICVYYYDKKIFIVLYRDFNPSSFSIFYECFCPPILFYYDIEKNAAKYMGYLSEWFDYNIRDLRGTEVTGKMFTIVKT